MSSSSRLSVVVTALTLASIGARAEEEPRVSVHTFGARQTVRIEPRVEGLRVIGGAQRYVVEGDELRATHTPSLTPVTRFSRANALVDEAHAVVGACAKTTRCWFTDATVERTDGLAQRVWFSTDAGLRAAYAVRVPAWELADVRDLVMDAETGDVLASRSVVKFGVPPAPTKAHVFQNFAPSGPDADLDAELEVVDLEGLLPAPVGGHLRGEHFSLYNCCKQYTCKDGSQTCVEGAPCTDDGDCAATQHCSAPTDGECVLNDGVPVEEVADCADIDTVDKIDSFVSLAIPTALIPSPFPLPFETLYARVAFCKELPRALSEAGAGPGGEDGWFPNVVDVDRSENDAQGKASEEDAEAEVMAYWSTQQYFEHVRTVLDDPAFCLEALSMSCDENGASVLNGDGVPELPFHITVNSLIPKIDINNIGAQVLGGAGGTPGNPVQVPDFARLPNAAFIPALEGGPINIPPELQALAALFTRPYDSNVYFQGFRDFAYDGDVVRHEFTHGIVHTLNPELQSNGRDEYGSHVQPGALNEGWADYFSASFLDDAEMAEYASAGIVGQGETSLRNAVNDKKCPDDVIGEVHADAEYWTGALWSVREQAEPGDIATLDRALFAAVEASAADEDFAAASVNAVDAIRAALGDALADAAQAEFDARAISACERVHPLAIVTDGELTVTRKDQLFQPGAGDIAVTNFAPAAVQFQVQVPPGSGGFTLSWSQGAGGLAGAVGGGDPEPMLVLVEETDGAIQWTYEGATGGLAVPHTSDGTEIEFDAADAANAAEIGAANGTTGLAPATFTKTFDTDPCEARSFIVQILSPQGGAVLQDIDLQNIDTEAQCDTGGEGEGEGEAPACGCRGVGDATPFVALVAGLVLVRRRRR